jgi:hypothetical protein
MFSIATGYRPHRRKRDSVRTLFFSRLLAAGEARRPGQRNLRARPKKRISPNGEFREFERTLNWVRRVDLP